MSSSFDIYEKRLTSTVERVFGVPASWTPSAGGDTITGRMLYNAPSKDREGSNDIEYDPTKHQAEYRKEDFGSLYDNVRNGLREQVTVDGDLFAVQNAKPIHDGDTVLLTLQPLA